jgi:hypothetical protein
VLHLEQSLVLLDQCANNLLVGRAAYETAVRLYPRDVIQYRDRARIIARSEPKTS